MKKIVFERLADEAGLVIEVHPDYLERVISVLESANFVTYIGDNNGKTPYTLYARFSACVEECDIIDLEKRLECVVKDGRKPASYSSVRKGEEVC